MTTTPRLTRRFALLLVLLLTSLGAACSTTAPQHAGAEHAPDNAEAALEFLLEGNERFVAGEHTHDHRSVARRMKLTEGQEPFAVILTCADSRVVPEFIFDVGLGDVFVIRVAGNVVADDEAGSIEYAVEHLGVEEVLVLGHEGCGAVTAALSASIDERVELSRLLELLRPGLAGIDRSLPLERQIQLGVEVNARHSAEVLEDILLEESAELAGVRVEAAVYELETGAVRLLEPR